MAKIGILGPSKLSKGKRDLENIKKIAKIIANKKEEIIISPDKKSTAEFFAIEYKKNKGQKIIGIDYKDDRDNKYKGLNRKICDKLINVKTWENQPKELIKKADKIISLGLSIGVLWEICLTKFYNHNIKILIIKELNKDKLPRIMEKELNIKYTSINKL
ncbi:MAG: hypothetical protein Q8P15_00575 [Nanoarchaeota archaeon]|nr:hypothetical protein [Nanoarchaeota archaeon]